MAAFLLLPPDFHPPDLDLSSQSPPRTLSRYAVTSVRNRVETCIS